MSCASSAIEHDATNIEGVWLFLTGILNTLLACMIVWKLVEARRDMLKVGMSDPAAQYISTMSIVIESSGAWVISIILFLASNFSPAGYLQSMSPFFQQLTQIMPVRRHVARRSPSSADDCRSDDHSRTAASSHRAGHSIHAA
jgi:hypothetical protein